MSRMMIPTFLFFCICSPALAKIPFYNISETRQPVILKVNSYPWRAIGSLVRIDDDREQHGLSTAFLVGPNLILANAHSIRGFYGFPTKKFQFIPNPQGKWNAPRVDAEVIAESAAGKFVNLLDIFIPDGDWALLRLSEYTGLDLGYFGILTQDGRSLPGFRGNLTESPVSNENVPACEMRKAVFKNSIEQLVERPHDLAKDNLKFWWNLTYQDDRNWPSVCFAGNAAAVNSMTLVASSKCQIFGSRSRQERFAEFPNPINHVFLSDCVSSPGNSGAPIFITDGAEAFVVAINFSSSDAPSKLVPNLKIEKAGISTPAKYFFSAVESARTQK